ncbi:TonB-dependent receptor plug domain-containing protein [Rhodocytophaga rosea]|uniref:TonB-dependent receptor plug domain-containing protein n=1 Tax=Rhodocytophaga rosea TaxID=2704465 RepID=A0A6C0GPS4_9BACT|nr:TonB-dependent receptor plug domain-containing protein [Rhodocytophaga rosea]QHT70056.1 TonB-dependent receptor plug domain-containing protein [Rhodocytophaga rosea]
MRIQLSRIIICILFCLTGTCPYLKAQIEKPETDTLSLSDFYDMTLQQLDSVKASGVSSELEKFINSLISVATQKSLSTRNTPGIITLITEEEIKTSGARDLIDVLRQVPGFDFALDGEGRVGIGIRGNWANEGKVLLLIDGQEMNEIYTANLFFGNHYPVEFIKRIEIIRGPGSAIYGGFAEFGVINIITKGVEDLNGISVSAVYGQMQKTYGRHNLYLYGGKKWKNAALSLSLFNGGGQRSDRDHYGFYNDEWADSLGAGAYASLAGNSELNPSYSNLLFTWKKLSFRSVGDFYDVTDITLIDNNKKRRSQYGINNTYHELKYDFKVSEKLKITPKLNFILQFPVRNNVPDSITRYDQKNFISRSKANITASYDASHRTNFIGGVEYFNDFARASSNGVFRVGDKNVSYHNIAAFGQGIFNLPFVNITAGIRYDWNSSFGSAFVPRLGLTKRLPGNKWHFKLLLSDVFRAPSIGNVVNSFNGNYTIVNPGRPDRYILPEKGIKPERTFVAEAEVGYQINSRMILTANVFDMTIRNPIVYYFYQDDAIRDAFYENAGINVFSNFKRTGTRGYELDYRFKTKWGSVSANYSFYSLESKPRIAAYSVSTFNRNPEKRAEVNNNQVLGLANHKLNVNATYFITQNFSANVTATFYGKRYGYDVLFTGPGKFDVDGQLIRRSPVGLANLYFHYQNLFTKGLDVGIGAYNLFNSKYDFLQPNFALNTPVPGPSREIIVKAGYSFEFRKKKKKV